MSQLYCAICNQPVTIRRSDPAIATLYIECEQCGKYFIDETLAMELYDGKYALEKAKLIVAVRVRSETAKKGGMLAAITADNIEDLIAPIRLRSDPLETADSILVWARRQMKSFSGTARINVDKDFPLFYLQDSGELMATLEYMRSTVGWISSQADSTSRSLRIDPPGYHRLQELRSTGHTSTQAFIAMRFIPEMNVIYNQAIFPAVYEAGFDPYRVDNAKNNNPIDNEIIAGLKASALVVADFTELRSAVFFEAGYGLGMGLPVIWTVREDYFDKMAEHFDTRQYPYTIWKDAADLKKQLKERILATVSGSFPRDPIVK